MNMELRFNNVEFRAEDDGTFKVSGYVNQTEQYSQVLGYTKRFKEMIKKGCFQRAIQNAKWDIDFLCEHDNSKILSSTRNGSLILREDDIGLYMEATIEKTSYGVDAYTLIKSGIFRNMSFGFKVVKDNWRMLEPNLYERVVEEMELYEVSVVKEPAYQQSTIAARGIDIVEDVDIPEEVIKEGELMEELRKLIESMDEEIKSLKDELKEVRSELEAYKETAKIDETPDDNKEERTDENHDENHDDDNKSPDENHDDNTEEKEERKDNMDENLDEKKDEKVEEPEEKREEKPEEKVDNTEEILADLNSKKAILAALKTE